MVIKYGSQLWKHKRLCHIKKKKTYPFTMFHMKSFAVMIKHLRDVKKKA